MQIDYTVHLAGGGDSMWPTLYLYVMSAGATVEAARKA